MGRELVSEAIRVVAGDDTGSGEHATVLEVGRRLGTRWVMHGGYQRLGDQLRITGRLVDVETNTIVRTAKVDGAIDDLFTLQDRLAAALVNGTGMDSGRASGRPGPRAAVADPLPAPGRVVGDPDAGEVSGIPSTSSISGFEVRGVIDGPPPPMPPEVITRNEQGQATIRAIKLTEGIRLDGQLDEQVYQTAPAITGFVQQAPDEGAPATEKTEAWIMFDGPNIYVAARVWDSAPPSEWVANRDAARHQPAPPERHLRRGVRHVLRSAQRRLPSTPILSAPLPTLPSPTRAIPTATGTRSGTWRTGRFDGGWTVEMEIPFKSLRYRQGPAQVWGVQLRRNVRRKNEWAYITPLPISGGSGPGGIFRVSDAATLVGLEVPGRWQESGNQTVWDRWSDDRRQCQSSAEQCRGRRFRRRREIRHHTKSHG